MNACRGDNRPSSRRFFSTKVVKRRKEGKKGKSKIFRRDGRRGVGEKDVRGNLHSLTSDTEIKVIDITKLDGFFFDFFFFLNNFHPCKSRRKIDD